MGGCTSKPKVLKDDEAFAPEPAPEKVIEEDKETVATELAPQQEPEKVVQEIETKASEPASQKAAENEEAVNGVVDDGFEKENGEGKNSSASETVKDIEDEKVKSEGDQTAAPEKVEKEEVKPAVEAQNSETLEKKPEGKTETLVEKKQEEAKPEPEKIPIFSFFTSLMGQKKN